MKLCGLHLSRREPQDHLGIAHHARSYRKRPPASSRILVTPGRFQGRGYEKVEPQILKSLKISTSNRQQYVCSNCAYHPKFLILHVLNSLVEHQISNFYVFAAYSSKVGTDVGTKGRGRVAIRTIETTRTVFSRLNVRQQPQLICMAF